MSKTLKKSDLIKLLVNSLSSEQISLVEELLGRAVTPNTLITQFTKTFKKTISVSSRKGKGRNLQKWVAEKLSVMLGIPCGKDCEIQSREMGQSGTDVRLSKTVQERFPYSIECKSQESWSILTWIEQAKNNTPDHHDWLLFVKKTGIEPVVLMSGNAFFRMISKIFKPILVRREK